MVFDKPPDRLRSVGCRRRRRIVRQACVQALGIFKAQEDCYHLHEGSKAMFVCGSQFTISGPFRTMTRRKEHSYYGTRPWHKVTKNNANSLSKTSVEIFFPNVFLKEDEEGRE